MYRVFASIGAVAILLLPAQGSAQTTRQGSDILLPIEVSPPDGPVEWLQPLQRTMASTKKASTQADDDGKPRESRPNNYLWPFPKLQVCFVDVISTPDQELIDKRLQSTVMDEIEQWNRVGAGIVMDAGSTTTPNICGGKGAHIRILIKDSNEVWSRLGTEALLFPRRPETMVLNRSDPDDPLFRSTIRHELGHALGLVHEMQRDPPHGCQTEYRHDILTFMQELEGRNVAHWRRQLLPIPGHSSSYDSRPFSNDSVMMYALPMEAFNVKNMSEKQANRCFVMQRSTTITRSDAAALRAAYNP